MVTMKFYQASADIAASPNTIWSILTDAPGLSTWDSGIQRVEGRIAPGETITVYSEANPGRAFPVKVVDFAQVQRMRWSGGMPLGLFKGERTFTLTPRGEGITRVHIREEYTGPLLGLIWKSIPDLQPSFDKFASGLKKRAEQPG
jgi:hypothetical protein